MVTLVCRSFLLQVGRMDLASQLDVFGHQHLVVLAGGDFSTRLHGVSWHMLCLFTNLYLRVQRFEQ